MAHSSWGPGWPNCQSSKINKSFVVKTVQGNINFPGGIRIEIEELTRRLVQETAKRGYKFGVPGDPSYGCWGYNCRNISGSNTPSNHSWGLAVDINAPSNPYKAPLTTDMPGWMPDLWNAYGFRWGGDYTSSKKDAMHYEFLGSVTDATNYTNKARQNKLGESSSPVPVPPGGAFEEELMFFKGSSATIYLLSGSLVAGVHNTADLTQLQKAAKDPGYVAVVSDATRDDILKNSTSRSD